MTIEYHSNIRTDIVPLVPQVDKLLDVGGGVGATVRHLKQIGRAREIGVMDAVVEDHLDGLDFASGVNLDDHDLVEQFLAGVGPLDAILMLDVLEHLVDPWSVVELFSRHLRPGGVLIASIPNIRHISVSGPLLFANRWTYTEAGLLDRTHLRFFVRDTAVELMDREGLTVEKVEPSPLGSRIHKLVNALTFGSLRSLFTLQYFVVARRDG